MKVVQIAPRPAPGRPGSDESSVLHSLFLSWGWESVVHCEEPPGRDEEEKAGGPSLPPLDPDDLLIYHYYITFPVAELVSHPPERTAVILHERLPTTLLDHYAPDTMIRIVNANAQLWELSQGCELAIGHTTFTGDELERVGFKRVRELPVLVDYDALNEPPDPFTLAMLDDGTPKMLYVGDLHPASGAEDLIKTAWYYRSFMGEPIRLFLSGSVDAYPGYFAVLSDAIGNLEAGGEAVVFTGDLTHAQLRAYYRRADVYLHFSGSDGDGAGLLQAFHYGVPVVARARAAAPEVLGMSGVLLDEPIHSAAAESVHRLLHDNIWRSLVLQHQRTRLDLLNRESIAFQLRSLLSRFIIQ